MADKTTAYKTKTGKVLTDVDIEAMADDVEGEHDVEALKVRRRGRPMLGSTPMAGVGYAEARRRSWARLPMAVGWCRGPK